MPLTVDITALELKDVFFRAQIWVSENISLSLGAAQSEDLSLSELLRFAEIM